MGSAEAAAAEAETAADVEAAEAEASEADADWAGAETDPLADEADGAGLDEQPANAAIEMAAATRATQKRREAIAGISLSLSLVNDSVRTDSGEQADATRMANRL